MSPHDEEHSMLWLVSSAALIIAIASFVLVFAK